MTRAPQIQPLPAWPTTPGISHTDRPAPLLLEEKGLGDEVDAMKKGPGVALSEVEGDEVDATKKGLGVALSACPERSRSEVEGDEVDATKKGPGVALSACPERSRR
jgi:hypothetical protein